MLGSSFWKKTSHGEIVMLTSTLSWESLYFLTRPSTAVRSGPVKPFQNDSWILPPLSPLLSCCWPCPAQALSASAAAHTATSQALGCRLLLCLLCQIRIDRPLRSLQPTRPGAGCS